MGKIGFVGAFVCCCLIGLLAGGCNGDGGGGGGGGTHVMWGTFGGVFQASGNDYDCVDGDVEVLGSTSVGPLYVTMTAGGSSSEVAAGSFYPLAYLYVPASGSDDRFGVQLEGGTCDATVTVNDRTVVCRVTCGDGGESMVFTYTYVYSADYETIEATMETKIILSECGGGEYVNMRGSWQMSRLE